MRMASIIMVKWNSYSIIVEVSCESIEPNNFIHTILDRSVHSAVANNIRGYKINDLGQPANIQKFFWKGKDIEVTVNDYYKKHYGIDLKFVYENIFHFKILFLYLSIDIQHCLH
jgi:hypothetical protein